MSILDTFYILFKTDADQAAKDIKEVDKASDQAAGGLKKMDGAADGVASSIGAMTKGLMASVAALVSVNSLMNVAIDRAAAVRELDSFSAKLNSSIEDVDAFQRSVKGMGGETAAALDSLVKIGEKVNEAFSDKDSGARKDFEAWGLAFKNSKGEALGASDAMLELSRNLEDVSNAEALARIKKLGIEDPTTIEALMLGRRTLEDHIAAQKEMGVVTEENAFAVREYYAALGDAQNLLTTLGNGVLRVFLPIATEAIDIFGDVVRWLMDNQRLVEGFFLGISGILTLRYTPAMIQAGRVTLMALAPYLRVALAIAAIGTAAALAYEDIRAFMDGQPSLIGALAEKYEWFDEVVKGIGDTFKDLKGAAEWLASADSGQLGEIARVLLSLDGLEASALAVGSLTLALSPLARTLFMFALAFSAAKAGLDYLGALKGGLDDKIAATVAVDNPRQRPGYVESAGYDEDGKFIYMDGPGRRVDRPAENPTAGFTDDAMETKLQMMQEEGQRIEDQLSRAKTLLDGAAASPINGQTSQSVAPPVTNNEITNTVNVGGVTVNTQATDAKAVAGAVKGELQRQLRGTAAQFDDGVDR